MTASGGLAKSLFYSSLSLLLARLFLWPLPSIYINVFLCVVGWLWRWRGVFLFCFPCLCVVADLSQHSCRRLTTTRFPTIPTHSFRCQLSFNASLAKQWAVLTFLFCYSLVSWNLYFNFVAEWYIGDKLEASNPFPSHLKFIAIISLHWNWALKYQYDKLNYVISLITYLN